MLYLIFVLLFSLAFAQEQEIGYPPNGTHVPLGSTLTVEVLRPIRLQGSVEVGMVIAIQSCPTNPCLSPETILGETILYNGPYNPQNHDVPGFISQNFSVIIPAPGEFGGPVAQGRAQLSVARFHMIGAVSVPLLTFRNVTLIMT